MSNYINLTVDYNDFMLFFPTCLFIKKEICYFENRGSLE
jgi:hypothetical protein